MITTTRRVMDEFVVPRVCVRVRVCVCVCVCEEANEVEESLVQ